MVGPYWFKQAEYYVSKPEPVLNKGEIPKSKIEPNTLIIQSLGIEALIINVTEKNESVFQEALTRGVGHYPDTASIGQYGNAYLFGHSSDYIWKKGTNKTVFALLPHIKIGDKIIASDNSGTPFTYKVTSTKVTSPDDMEVLNQYDNKKKLLTLQTSYPVGTILQRFLVIAEVEE